MEGIVSSLIEVLEGNGGNALCKITIIKIISVGKNDEIYYLPRKFYFKCIECIIQFFHFVNNNLCTAIGK